MATYRSRTHHSLTERLTDAAIGGACGVGVAVLLWLATVWMRFH